MKNIEITQVHDAVRRERRRMKQHELYMRKRDELCIRQREYRNKNKTEIKKRLLNKHPLVYIHSMMLERCGVRKCKNSYMLSRYADRGITVCNEWIKLSSFEEWALSHGWRKELELDRIDNDKGYTPDNCRFVTRSQNCRNRSSNRIVVYNGKKKTLVEFVEDGKTKLGYDATRKRLANGWSVKDAFETPRVSNQHRKEVATC